MTGFVVCGVLNWGGHGRVLRVESVWVRGGEARITRTYIRRSSLPDTPVATSPEQTPDPTYIRRAVE